MPIEVELKARVTDAAVLRALLAERSPAAPSTYHDTYYDWPDGGLERDHRRELRVRVVDAGDHRRTVLTYKAPMIGATSTPEYETTVSDSTAIDEILTGLGLVHAVAYQKRCWNYSFRAEGHAVTATVVVVPEIGGEAFLEVETIVDGVDDIPAAESAIRNALGGLGIGEQDLTDEFYVDRVRRERTIRATQPRVT